LNNIFLIDIISGGQLSWQKKLNLVQKQELHLKLV